MKPAVNTARIIVGVLFIFSGLVKAIDPLGLAYKMEEFFEAWHNGGFLPGLMTSLSQYAVPFSVVMIVLEVAAGVALLLGLWRRITTWSLFLLIVFFTFLTSYVLFSGKIRACGCFGDCIPLTPIQTFSKDIILLILVIILLLGNKHIKPLFTPRANKLLWLVSIVATIALLWFVQYYLPLIDCLPYKKGNNIVELRKMPKNAVPDKFEYLFTYQKNGEKKDFSTSNLPDSTWSFVDRKQTLVKKGSNNVPVINDFSLSTLTGTDTTEAVLNTPGKYYLLFVKDLEDVEGDTDLKLAATLQQKKLPYFIVTAQPDKVGQRFSSAKALLNPVILTCDGVAIKTAARTKPTLYLMEGPVVKQKWGKAALSGVVKELMK